MGAIVSARDKLKNVAGAKLTPPRAPSAPAAPGVRSNGSTSAAATLLSAPTATRPAAGRLSPPLATGLLGGAKSGGLAQGGLNMGKPSPATPSGGGTQKPKPGAAGIVTDPQYWNNVMALNAQYGLEKQTALTDQRLADSSYTSESTRMETDRARARRNLAESLLGRGNIYGGAHRREQTEADTDHILNRGRLDNDKLVADQQRIAELADIEARLAPNVGTEWQHEALLAQERRNAALNDQVETGDPDYSLTLNQQIKAANKKIKRLRAKADKIEDPKRRARVRKRIQKVRKRRDHLVKKRDS